MSVLIIEKMKLPRQKVCGGGLTKRTLDILPFSIEPVVEDLATSVILSVKNHTVFSKAYDHPITALVMRDRFDHYLVQQAIDKGAALMDNTEFIDVNGSPGNLMIETSRGRISARIIAGSDGLHSRVASCLKLPVKKKQMTAVEAEIQFKEQNKITDRFKHSMQFDIGHVPSGYGWIFPKKNHLSIGILSLSSKRKGIRNDLKAFIKTKQIDRKIDAISVRGYGIPYGPSPKNRYSNPLGLLVGDATGIVDPITGEGIYYAVRGAQIASEAITAFMAGGKHALPVYDATLKQTLFPEIGCAQKLAHILYKCERLSHRALKIHGARIAENHVNIIIGVKTYRQLYREVFSLSGLRTLLAC
jgi:geranylgeranyl reductase family protein